MKRSQLIATIAKAYDLNVVEVLPVQKGYRNESHVLKLTGEYVNIILYKSEKGILQRIHNADKTTRILANQGLPVRLQISPKIIQVTSANSVQYGGLYNYLPGSTISWEGYTKDHLRSLGLTMARMHLVLSKSAHTRDSVPSIFDECIALVMRMDDYFKESGVQVAVKQKLQLDMPKYLTRFLRLFEKLRMIPDQQLLHMDFVRGNVLFNDQTANSPFGYGRVEVSGIIDFEKTAFGPPVFDVARTLAFLLIDAKYKSEGEVRRYFLHSGYQKYGEGTLQTHYRVAGHPINMLEILVDFFLLHDFYKFLLHNPYEYLPSNEHYVRTVALLKRRGRLQVL